MENRNGENIAFLGAGKMARSLATAFFRHGRFKGDQIVGTVRSPDDLEKFKEVFPFRLLTSNAQAVRESRFIVLSVRPQQLKPLLAEIRDELTEEKILISVAAGIPLGKIRDAVRKQIPLLHVHPSSLAFNLSAKGISFLVAADWVDKETIQKVKAIFESIGEVVETNEEELNKFAVLAGCAPAYLALLVFQLSEIGTELGLPLSDSLRLENLVFSGVRDAIVDEGWKPQEILERIATAEGVTIEGLKVLSEKGTKEILRLAVEASLSKLQYLRTILD